MPPAASGAEGPRDRAVRLGHPVLRLHRSRYAGLGLEGLAPGEWRQLTSEDRLGLSSAARSEWSEQLRVLRVDELAAGLGVLTLCERRAYRPDAAADPVATFENERPDIVLCELVGGEEIAIAERARPLGQQIVRAEQMAAPPCFHASGSQ